MQGWSTAACQFDWAQSFEEVLVEVQIPAKVTVNDVVVKFDLQSLLVLVGSTCIITGMLAGQVSPQESSWSIGRRGSSRVLSITLCKAAAKDTTTVTAVWAMYISGCCVALKGHSGSYCIDVILGESATQQQTYDCAVAPLVDSFLQGENAVLLAYGASQTGKSYTLQGSGSLGGSNTGVIHYAAKSIARGLSIIPKNKYSLSATYCCMSVGHDAQLLDLLSPSPASSPVSLRDCSASAAVASLNSVILQDPMSDILQVLECRRLLDSTTAAASIRSGPKGYHSMLKLQLDMLSTADGTGRQRNCLCFVELAAPDPKDPRSSENATAASRSLAVAYNSLGKVLSALRHSAPAAAATAGGAPAGSQLHARVPWRDSPLTRWLQEHLDKATAITLLGTVSLLPESAADTLATVSWLSRFSSASRAGDGGVLVNFAWDALVDPAAPPG
eukprot:gene6387-6619_t